MFHFAFCLLFCVGKGGRERGETERKYNYIIIFYLCDMCKLHTQPTPWLTSHSVQ